MLFLLLLNKTRISSKITPTFKLSRSARSYCFDYQKLVDQFGINLITGDSDDEEE